MTSLLATRRRAEEFARLVDEGRRSHDPNIAPLLELVAMFRPPAVEPAASFRSSLRQRLVLAAEGGEGAAAPISTLSPAARSAVRTPQPVRWIAVAASVALTGGMVGTAAAAREAMPGETLYGLKLGLERTEVAVTTNDQSRGREHLKLAEHRLREVVALVGSNGVPEADHQRVELIGQALEGFAAQADRGGSLLLAAYERSEDEDALNRVASFASGSRAALGTIEARLPANLQSSHGQAVDAVRSLEERLGGLCPQCAPVVAKSLPDQDEENRAEADEPVEAAPAKADGDSRDGKSGSDAPRRTQAQPAERSEPDQEAALELSVSLPGLTDTLNEPTNDLPESTPEPTFTVAVPNPLPKPTTPESDESDSSSPTPLLQLPRLPLPLPLPEPLNQLRLPLLSGGSGSDADQDSMNDATVEQKSAPAEEPNNSEPDGASEQEDASEQDASDDEQQPNEPSDEQQRRTPEEGDSPSPTDDPESDADEGSNSDETDWPSPSPDETTEEEDSDGSGLGGLLDLLGL